MSAPRKHPASNTSGSSSKKARVSDDKDSESRAEVVEVSVLEIKPGTPTRFVCITPLSREATTGYNTPFSISYNTFRDHYFDAENKSATFEFTSVKEAEAWLEECQNKLKRNESKIKRVATFKPEFGAPADIQLMTELNKSGTYLVRCGQLLIEITNANNPDTPPSFKLSTTFESVRTANVVLMAEAFKKAAHVYEAANGSVGLQMRTQYRELLDTQKAALDICGHVNE